MSHNLPHTMLRSGSFVFNRRVPRAVQSDFGCEFVRVRLGRDREHARLLAASLTRKLNEIWSSPSVRPVEVTHILETITPRVVTLDDAVECYLLHKGMDRGPNFEKVVRLAQRLMVRVSGNRNIEQYTRDDARVFLRYLQATGVKTRTIRRRIDTIKAIFQHIFIEEAIEKRNPFARLGISGEGMDSTKRRTFTLAQLQLAYRVALSTKNEIKLIVPLLGETGCRLAEIVGLRLCDVNMEQETITVTPHPARRLKTRGSERVLPLVGAAIRAMKLVLEKRADDDWLLFPRYERDGFVLATHASNAINKWLKREFDGLTCHCLRHTMRDRLRAVEAPLDMIDQIGGWSSTQSVGVRYGQGYQLTQVHRWLASIALPLDRVP